MGAWGSGVTPSPKPRSLKKGHSCPDLQAPWLPFPCPPGCPASPLLPPLPCPHPPHQSLRSGLPQTSPLRAWGWEAARACPEGEVPRVLSCASWGWPLGQAAPSLCSVVGWVGPCPPPLNCRPACGLNGVQKRGQWAGRLALGEWGASPPGSSGEAWPEPGVSVSLAAVEGVGPCYLFTGSQGNNT